MYTTLSRFPFLRCFCSEAYRAIDVYTDDPFSAQDSQRHDLLCLSLRLGEQLAFYTL